VFYSLQTILGARVTQHLQNVKEARKERRKKFGEDIDFKSTMRYGKICSPFQAVQTKVCTVIKTIYQAGHELSCVSQSWK